MLVFRKFIKFAVIVFPIFQPGILTQYKQSQQANNSLCGQLVSSLEFPIKFVERFKVMSVPFLIPETKLLSYESDNFTFKVLYWVILF